MRLSCFILCFVRTGDIRSFQNPEQLRKKAELAAVLRRRQWRLHTTAAPAADLCGADPNCFQGVQIEWSVGVSDLPQYAAENQCSGCKESVKGSTEC